MCIAIISTAHPAYSLIVADNRDVSSNPAILREKKVLTMRYRNSYTDQPLQPIGGRRRTSTCWVHEISPAQTRGPGWG